MDFILNFFFSGLVKSTLETELSDHLQLPVQINEANVRWSGGSLKNITVIQPAPFEKEGSLLDIEKIKFKCSWWDLLFKEKVDVQSVKIQNPLVHVIKRGLLFGDINLTHIPEVKPPKKDLTFEKLKLKNVKVDVKGPWMKMTYPLGSWTFKDINRNRLSAQYRDLWEKIK